MRKVKVKPICGLRGYRQFATDAEDCQMMKRLLHHGSSGGGHTTMTPTPSPHPLGDVTVLLICDNGAV